jgi:hypothetical protein
VKCDKNTPVGTKVKMVDCLEAERYSGRVWTTVSKPWLLNNGAWVVMLKGYAGCFYLGYLEVVDEKDN